MSVSLEPLAKPRRFIELFLLMEQEVGADVRH